LNTPLGLVFRSIWDNSYLMMIMMRWYLVLQKIKSCYTITAVPMTVVKNSVCLSSLIVIQLVCVPKDVQRLIFKR